VAAWEITVSPAAMWAPYGPTKVLIYEDEGRLSEEEVATYDSLPVRNDLDSIPDDRDDFVKAALNAQLAELGHNPIGLPGSESGAPVAATLLEGDYIASHVYGWTEFEIDAVTQALTVTTWGIPPYAEMALARDPAEVASRTPEVVSRFVVEPRSP
jgi:3-phytase/alkaline phosphatase D